MKELAREKQFPEWIFEKELLCDFDPDSLALQKTSLGYIFQHEFLYLVTNTQNRIDLLGQSKVSISNQKKEKLHLVHWDEPIIPPHNLDKVNFKNLNRDVLKKVEQEMLRKGPASKQGFYASYIHLV